jgi:ornithine cyclodeaminase/alanine dehydrogenase-like protein (mu-crystallin family)
VFYYDVTDPARPLWKVLVNVLFGDNDAEHPYNPTAPHGYFVVMDARTGEVLRVVERTVNTDIREIV